MGTHTVTGTVTGAYILVSASNTLSVTATGYIEGGVYAFESAVYHVDNYGRISNTSSITQSGVYLEDGGVVVNGSPAGGAATIQGAYDGVLIKSSTNLVGAVTNFGSIRGGRYGIYLVNGNVTNGSDSDTTATVSAPGVASGEKGAAVDCVAPGSSVFNYGSILQLGAEAARGAVYLRDGGAVTNGARHDTNALIEGSSGVTVDGATGVVLNQGAIEGLYFYGVQLTAGGRVTNGALNDRTALIEGYDIGVAFTTSAGTVTNFGTIEGRGAAAGAPAVLLADGGVVTNGAAGDRVATIDGLSGLLITTAAGTLTNFGSIVGSGGATQYGVKMTLGGELTNGAPGDAAAVIQGYQSVVVTGGAGAVTNFGSILGTGGADAYVISITGGGSVTNGSYGDEGALIAGYKGIWIAGGAGTVSNFGSINGAVSGVALVAGGVVSNGSFEDRTAVIDGGVVIQGRS